MAKRAHGGPEDRLIGPDREARLKAKKRFAKALTTHGVRWIEKLIERGPGRVVIEVDGKRVVQSCEQQRLEDARFEFAMNFAADRGGGFQRETSVQVDGTEAMAPIHVRFTNFERPADT